MDDIQEGYSVIEIQLLKVELTFDEFTFCLERIRRIYSELSQVMHVEGSYTPLKVVKIESGSLHAILSGIGNVVETFGLLFEKIVYLCFEKFTRTGQIHTQREVQELVKGDLALRDELAKRGLDTESADEHIVKSFTIVTKETLRLAGTAPKFKINGKVLEYNEFENQKYLEANKLKLLTDQAE